MVRCVIHHTCNSVMCIMISIYLVYNSYDLCKEEIFSVYIYIHIISCNLDLPSRIYKLMVFAGK